MKPLNLDNRPCSPISSNCVIWQGADIPCINLCSGDTVSDVVYKLAIELCTILDQLNVSAYDLSCLDLNTCPPEDFKGLIQLLIDTICASNGITTTSEKAGGCPDCVVTVASCFVESNQTTMQLVDYVQMIANKVCSLVAEIVTLQNQINALDVRVTILENTPPPTFTLPSILVDCTLADGTIVGGNSYPIDQILDALINDDVHGYCALKGATGEAESLLAAVASQCVDNTDDSLSFPGQTMATAYFGSWVNSPVTVADSIENLWIALCDIRNASLSLNVVDTNTVNLTFNSVTNQLEASVQDTGWVNLEGFDFYTGSLVNSKPQCRRIGNVIHFRGNVIIPLSSSADGSTLINATSFTNYYTQAYPYTYGANPAPAGGVLTNSNGSITFNEGNSCIPTSVWAGSLDNAYSKGRIFAIRQIQTESNHSTALATTLSVSISSTGRLVCATLKDLEIAQGYTFGDSASPLNYISSNVRSTDYIPLYRSATTTIQNAPAGSPDPYDLVSDRSTVTWPFDCDSSEETEIGGFIFVLDGLSAFISPCEATVATPIPCLL